MVLSNECVRLGPMEGGYCCCCDGCGCCDEWLAIFLDESGGGLGDLDIPRIKRRCEVGGGLEELLLLLLVLLTLDLRN